MKISYAPMSRNYSIDAIKIVAMLGVIMLHTSHDLMSESGYDLASFMYKSAVASIPLFFMVSGYLLLGRQDIGYGYILRKIIRILRYMAVIILAFWLIRGLIKGNLIISDFISIYIGSFFVKGPFFVFWYFGALIILYLILPIANYIYRKYPSVFLLATILLMVIQNCVFLNNLTIINGERIPAALRVYNWLTYLCLGGLIRNVKQIRGSMYMVVIMLIANFFTQQYFIKAANTSYCSFFYSAFPILVYTCSIFNYIEHIKLITPNKIITELSKLFLIVFTIHPFFISPVCKIMKNIPYLAPLFIWISVSLLSIITGYLIMKLPGANKLLSI